MFLLSYVQVVAAGQAVPAAPRGHLLFDRLQQGRTADDGRRCRGAGHAVGRRLRVPTTGIGNGGGGDGRFRPGRGYHADARATGSAAATAAAAGAGTTTTTTTTTGPERARLAGRRRQTDQQKRVGLDIFFKNVPRSLPLRPSTEPLPAGGVMTGGIWGRIPPAAPFSLRTHCSFISSFD